MHSGQYVRYIVHCLPGTLIRAYMHMHMTVFWLYKKTAGGFHFLKSYATFPESHGGLVYHVQ